MDLVGIARTLFGVLWLKRATCFLSVDLKKELTVSVCVRVNQGAISKAHEKVDAFQKWNPLID